MILGLYGRRGSGKTSSAERLSQIFGYSVYSFATPIKEALVAMGASRDVVFHNRDEVAPWFGKTGRELLQTLGTEWGRNHVHNDLWLDLMEKSIVEDHGCLASAHAVIDDVRFVNEVDRIHQWGGYVVEVNRGMHWQDDAEKHVSEKGIPESEVDFRLDNLSPYWHDLDFAVQALLQEIDEKEKPEEID